MNKIQLNFYKIVIQYVKETYPDDATLNYLIKGIENFTDENIQTEVEKPKYHPYVGNVPEGVMAEKERIKEIMNKILDVNFKPGNFVKPDAIYVREEDNKEIPDDEKIPKVEINKPEEDEKLLKEVIELNKLEKKIDDELEKVKKGEKVTIDLDDGLTDGTFFPRT